MMTFSPCANAPSEFIISHACHWLAGRLIASLRRTCIRFLLCHKQGAMLMSGHLTQAVIMGAETTRLFLALFCSLKHFPAGPTTGGSDTTRVSVGQTGVVRCLRLIDICFACCPLIRIRSKYLARAKEAARSITRLTGFSMSARG